MIPAWRSVHPLDPEWRLPVYIANFVLMEYGTGAIFGVPAHDQRDFEFATKYDLPIRRVVSASADQADKPVIGEAESGGGRDRQLALPGRARRREREGRGDPPRRGGRMGPGHDRLALRDWGVVPAALLGHPDPHHPLRGCGPCPCQGAASVVLPGVSSTCRAIR
jgi:leucyl-tRNA synthetase